MDPCFTHLYIWMAYRQRIREVDCVVGRLDWREEPPTPLLEVALPPPPPSSQPHLRRVTSLALLRWIFSWTLCHRCRTRNTKDNTACPFINWLANGATATSCNILIILLDWLVQNIVLRKDGCAFVSVNGVTITSDDFIRRFILNRQEVYNSVQELSSKSTCGEVSHGTRN
jgi:hypothetical protein